MTDEDRLPESPDQLCRMERLLERTRALVQVVRQERVRQGGTLNCCGSH